MAQMFMSSGVKHICHYLSMYVVKKELKLNNSKYNVAIDPKTNNVKKIIDKISKP